MAAKIPGESVLVDNRLRKAAGDKACFQNEPVGDSSLLEAPSCAEARRTCADDQVTYVQAVGGWWSCWWLVVSGSWF